MNTNDKQPEGSAKVSVSLPPDLLKWIDQAAANDRRPRSQWIAIQLEELLRARSKQPEQGHSYKANKRNAG